MKESYTVTGVSVYDGDTIRCELEMEVEIPIGKLPVEAVILGHPIKLEKVSVKPVGAVKRGTVKTLVLKGRVPVSARILGIDTPELKGPQSEAGKVVKKVVERWFARHLKQGHRIEAEFECPDKYNGRTVLNVFPEKWDESLAGFLLRIGYAKPYDGGTKSRWTKSELDAIVSRGVKG